MEHVDTLLKSKKVTIGNTDSGKYTYILENIDKYVFLHLQMLLASLGTNYVI